MYTPYADAGYYSDVYGGTLIPPGEIEKALKNASRHIDTLTYNRIVGKGVSSLTQYQQDIIRECCCEMADFESENADYISCVLKSYGINGVTMNFGENWNLEIQNGVAVRKDIYARLQSTGLTSRILR